MRSETPALSGGQLQIDFRRNRLGNLPLHAKEIGERAIVVFAPDGVGLDWLQQCDADADARVRSADRSADNAVDIQLFRNLLQRFGRVAVFHRRRARNDPQLPDDRHRADKTLGHPIGQILLIRVARLVVEREHHQAAHRARRALGR